MFIVFIDHMAKMSSAVSQSSREAGDHFVCISDLLYACRGHSEGTADSGRRPCYHQRVARDVSRCFSELPEILCVDLYSAA